jgi:DNA-binding transcriptional regulator YiaG
MSSSPASAEVISLTARAAARADYRGLSAAQLRSAREKAGLTPEEFADHLSDLVGWDIDPDLMRPWEAGRGMPPGDVVMACGQLLVGEPPPGLNVLGTIPGGFPAQALAGFWLTCYDFSHAGTVQYHADVAQVVAESGRHVTVTNHAPEPRTEGRASPFRNEIEAELVSRHLVGRWKNTSDTRYFGSLQLAVLPGETIMEGYYTGFGSDISVSSGRWKWVRLETGVIPEVVLREPAELHALAVKRSPYDAPLTLADVREDA